MWQINMNLEKKMDLEIVEYTKILIDLEANPWQKVVSSQGAMSQRSGTIPPGWSSPSLGKNS